MVGPLESDQTIFDMSGKIEILSDDFDPTAVVTEPLPSPVTNGGGGEREMVMGRNVHTTCLAVTEPESNDEFTGDKEAYMASVLARYRKTLVERTKYHLGNIYYIQSYNGILPRRALSNESGLENDVV